MTSVAFDNFCEEDPSGSSACTAADVHLLQTRLIQAVGLDARLTENPILFGPGVSTLGCRGWPGRGLRATERIW
jgi:hypothetical protein